MDVGRAPRFCPECLPVPNRADCYLPRARKMATRTPNAFGAIFPKASGTSLLFLFRVIRLVGDGGNVPVVVFPPCFETTVPQAAGQNITQASLNWWRQWELHPPQT